MKFNELVTNLIPLVNDASDLHCVIWRNRKGEWSLDYLNLDDEKSTIYFNNIKLIDPCALSVTGSEFSRGSYPFVYDEVLLARLRAEYDALGTTRTKEHNTLMNFLDDNMKELSSGAADYIASLDKPFAELNAIYMNYLKNESLDGRAGGFLLGQIEMLADKDTKATITALIIPSDVNDNAYVKFPATSEELNAIIKTGNIDDCRIGNITCGKIPILSHFLDNPTSDTKINELQYVSEIITNLTPDEIENVSAYLEMKLTSTADSIKENIITDKLSVEHVMDSLENRAAFNLDKTIMTDDDIGNKWLNTALETCQSAVDRLSESKNQDDKNLLNFIQTLNSNVDIAAYGVRLREENDMYVTSKGVISVDWSEFHHRDNRYIPDNTVDFIPPPNSVKPSILKTVDENKAKIAQADPPDKAKKKETAIE